MPKDECDSGNSEKPLIELLKTVLHDFFSKVEGALAKLDIRLGHHETKTEERHRKLMTALETLTASVNANTQGQAALTTAVNAAIVQLGTPGATDAQLLSLAAAVDSSTESDKALTDALNAALNPPTPPPTT
jgi:hypothetical protein